MISPEDLLVIKAVATAEHGSHHWYDALGIIARNPIDWDYLVERARQAGPRRVLSLLLYAESNDMAVPAEAVERLFTIVHPRSREAAHAARTATNRADRRTSPSTSATRWPRARPPSSASTSHVDGQRRVPRPAPSPRRAPRRARRVAAARPAGLAVHNDVVVVHGEPDLEVEVLVVIRVAAVGDIHVGPECAGRLRPCFDEVARPRRPAPARR